MASLDHSPFVFEVLIGGTQQTLDRARDITGFPEPGRTGCFSFDRIVPRPLCIEGTADRRTEFAERFLSEVYDPFEKLVDDFIDDDSLGFHTRQLGRVLHDTCDHLWTVGFAASQPGGDWMRENWGTSANAAPPQEQELGTTDKWYGSRLFARILVDGGNRNPPLIAFDALARMLPGAEIDLAWSSEQMYMQGRGTGIAKWRNGLRVSWTDSKLFDHDDPFGQLRSLRPLRMARAIRDAGFVYSRCRPTLRWNLTAVGFESLMEGETITIPIGPAHEATVGSDRDADFHVTPASRVDSEDIYWNYRVIQEDEAWHRVPGTVDGMSVALSLHSPEVIGETMRELVGQFGYANPRDWIASMWSW